MLRSFFTPHWVWLFPFSLGTNTAEHRPTCIISFCWHSQKGAQDRRLLCYFSRLWDRKPFNLPHNPSSEVTHFCFGCLPFCSCRHIHTIIHSQRTSFVYSKFLLETEVSLPCRSQLIHCLNYHFLPSSCECLLQIPTCSLCFLRLSTSHQPDHFLFFNLGPHFLLAFSFHPFLDHCWLTMINYKQNKSGSPA